MANGHAHEPTPVPGGEQDPQKIIAMLEERLRATPKYRVFERAVIRYNLGLAYSESPTGPRDLNLTRAAAALEDAARLFAQVARPMERARAQNALGAVLRELRRPEEAVEAFREAAELIPGEINPGEHAAALNNLGLALGDLGRVEEAVETFRQAVHFFTGPEFVRQRISALHNLGQALTSSKETARVREGIESMEAGLELADPEEHPYQWALLHHSIGVAYTAIGAPARAADSFRQALRVYTRSRFPFQYALTKNNLGLAFAQIGDVRALRRAVAAYEDGLRMLDVRLHRQQWEQVYRNLELAESGLADLGEKRSRMEHFVMMLAEEEAEAALGLMRERLTEYTLMPEPRRTDALGELTGAMLALPDEDARTVSAAWLHVLMELPHEQFMAGLTGWIAVYRTLDEAGQTRAAELVDRVVNDELLAPQRIRVRDTLYSMGWRRPGEVEEGQIEAPERPPPAAGHAPGAGSGEESPRAEEGGAADGG